MRRQLTVAIVVFVALTVLTGLVYPLVVTGVANVTFGDRATGSLVFRDGAPVGSSLIGQSFAGRTYFHPRPSAAGDGYDAMASAGSNLGPTNPELIDAAAVRKVDYRERNGLSANAVVPVEAITSSASGLDPHITPADARLQAPRVAAARGVPLARVLGLVDGATSGRGLGFLGEPGVNVLELNLSLDERL
jgi:K+-transporting ATPase ATPase C chain